MSESAGDGIEVLTEAQAKLEASRCLMCDDPPCVAACPARVPVKHFIRAIRFDCSRRAINLIRECNVLAGVCGLACPVDELCVGACRSTDLTVPVAIGKLQHYAAVTELGTGRVGRRGPRTGEKVAVVGGGPAGLAAAAELAKLGHQPTVFEKAPRAGGICTYGVPKHRVPQELVAGEIEYVKSLGVKIRTSSAFGPDHTIDDLFSAGFKAVYLAIGAQEADRTGIPGEDLAGVTTWKDMLDGFSAYELGEGDQPLMAGSVIIVGGGSVAIDVASAAARLGAADIDMVCLESPREMPAYRTELEEARSLGVRFHTRSMPVEITGGEGKVTGLRAARIRWKEPDKFVPSNAEIIAGTEYWLPGEMLVLAIGARPDPTLAEALPGVELDASGRVVVDAETGATSRPGLYAGGDVAVGGGMTIVQAVAEGRRAGQAIDAYLTEKRTEERDRSDDSAVITAGWQGTGRITGPVPSLSIEFCGVRFANPFVLSAAPPTDDLEMVRSAFEAGWGGAVLKTTSVETEPVALVYPMMSAIHADGARMVGLGNIDLISEHHIDVVEMRVQALKKEYPDRVVAVSIMGSKKEEWQELVKRLEAVGTDIIECSFSCPQGSMGEEAGAMLAQSVDATERVTGWVKEAAQRCPVVIKITPQVTDIVKVAQAVKRGGADAICAANTIPSLMGVDVDSFVPYPNVAGQSSYSGLSGPATRPITLRTLAEIAKKVDIPITATGGPMTWRDAVEMMLVGATTVQFCTAVMHYGYDIIDDLQDGLAFYLEDKGFDKPADITGKALSRIVPHPELRRDKPVICSLIEERCVKCDLCYIACRDGGHQAIKLDPATRLPRIDPDK